MDAESRTRPDQPPEDEGRETQRRRMALQNVETWVDQAIRQAQRRGDFDDLPGTGKPLRHLEREQDPDWWVKGLIEREQLDLSAAMPAALALRRERERFPGSLLDLADEDEVRARLEDFNQRVVADRRKPYFGPGSPVVVGRVDVEEMVQRWRQARADRLRRGDAGTTAAADLHDLGERPRGPGGRRPWWRRLLG
jgi:hypothetical protein